MKNEALLLACYGSAQCPLLIGSGRRKGRAVHAGGGRGTRDARRARHAGGARDARRSRHARHARGCQEPARRQSAGGAGNRGKPAPKGKGGYPWSFHAGTPRTPGAPLGHLAVAFSSSPARYSGRNRP